MAKARTSIHGEWSSKMAFILAATGSAVGLGNIWLFPYITGKYGGGAFVMVYLVCVVTIGVPIMMAEIMLGRRGRQSPMNTMATLAKEEKQHPAWKGLGWVGVIGGFMILSFYSVVAGWTLAYVFRTASGIFTNATADGVSSIFDKFISDPERLLAWHTIFMVMTIVVVSRGVKKGLETAVKYLMPALFILLIGMVGYAMNTGYFTNAIAYLFKPDFSLLTGEAVLAAMGQAFFSLSLGMGAIMIYGSYLPKKTSIARTTLIIAGLDTLVALLAGLAIFPIVFASGLQPDQDVGLVFKTLPIAFGQMPGGIVVGTLFFVLLTFAAWTSAISLLEPIVAWLVESHGMNRVMAAASSGLAAWLLGVVALLSLNVWSDYKLFDKNIFNLMSFATSNIMLPLGGLLIAVFAGWLMRHETSMDELHIEDPLHIGYRVWQFLVRVIAPIAVLFIFLNVTGVITWLSGIL